MNSINFFLEILIVFSIFASLTVITSTNPVIAIIYLIGVFLSAAIYLIFIGLNFIGISYIIVYIGAITVLFLFVIMLINIDLLDMLETGTQYNKILPAIITISVLFTVLFFNFIPFNDFYILPTFMDTLTSLNYLFGLSNEISNNLNMSVVSANPVNPEQVLINFLQIEGIGLNIYTNFALPLIISSIVLLLSMIAAIVVVKNK